MNRLILFLPLVLVGLTACRGDQRTATERLRADIDARVPPLMAEAQRAYDRGAYTLALALTDSVESIVPELADLHYLRGRVYTALHEPEVAGAAFETALELDPAYRGAHFNLGLDASQRGRLREAIAHFEAENERAEHASTWLEIGRAYAKLNRADSAEIAYRRAIALDSTNATAMMWLGQSYEEIGELEQALAWSRKGFALRPDNQNYRYIIGSLLHRMGRTQEAYDMLEPVAEELPWHHGAQYNMGQVMMALGREDEAQAYFAQADSAQQLQQQIADANAAVDADPAAIELWVELARLLRKAGQYEQAIEAYHVAVSLDPLNLYLQANLALLYMEDGRNEDAVRRLRAVVRVDSTLTDVWYNLGAAYANAGNYPMARQAWGWVVRQQPGNTAVRENLRRLDRLEAEARADTSDNEQAVLP